MVKPETIPSPQADANTTKVQLLPWQQPGIWYQALADFIGLPPQRYFYLQSTTDLQDPTFWQLALTADNTSLSAKSLSNYYSCALGPTPPSTTMQWRQCFQLIEQTRPRCRQLLLEPVSAHHLALLQDAKIPGWAVIALPISQNWQASTVDYWQNRSSQLRNTITRKKKKLAQLGAVISVTNHMSAQLQQAYWHVYERSWKPAEPTRHFINQLLQQGSDEGTLRLGVVSIAQQPVAVQCWLVAGGVAAIYKLAQDQQFDALSPGTVLTAAMVDHVIAEDQVHTLDFLTGDDAYKAQWMDSCSPLYQVTAYRLNNPISLAQFAVRHSKIWLQQLWSKLKPKTKESY